MRGNLVIVGGGVIGLSTAYYCAQAGYSVTVIDRNMPDRN
ncbi:MAG: dependent oxidoreductase, partial [Verrucomicrobiota bacterium]